MLAPVGIALDLAGGKMYWAASATHKIQRANLNGANVEDLVTSLGGFPSGIALDLAGGKMYWTVTATGQIQRANLDGTNVEDLITSGVLDPFGIALSLSGPPQAAPAASGWGLIGLVSLLSVIGAWHTRRQPLSRPSR